MNVLLFIGLVLFLGVVFWIYILFIANSIKDTKKNVVQEVIYDDVLGHCKKLYERGMHAELQRYAQRQLSNNYSDIELRRILAQSLLETGNDQMAIMHFEAILSIAPHDIQNVEFLANYYLEHGSKARAIGLFERIYAYDSGNINAVETLAQLYEETNNFDKAIDMYQLILDAEVDENRITELKYTLAELYIKIGNNQKAFDAYKNIYQNDSDNLEILMILADLAYKNGYWQDCLKYYNKIISIVGDDFEMLEKVAQLHTTLEHWADAIDTYNKIISLEDKTSSNYFYHQNELCNAMIKNKQYSEAITILKDLISQNPKETSFVFTLAQAYGFSEDYQKGINLYQKLLDELPPDNAEIIIKHISNILCAWAQNLFEKGDYNQAFDKFFEALKYNEENDEIYFELGKCNYYIKSIQDSIAHFKRAIAIKPQESKYYFGLGCAYDEMGLIKNAKSAFYDAINIDPMNIKARIAYAISLTKELEYAQSIEQFQEVLKYIPDNADTLYNCALAYEMIGDIERAIKYYKKAIDIEPNHKEANHNIELLLGEPYVSPNTVNTEEINNENIENNITENNNDMDFNFDIPIDNTDNSNSMFS